MAKSKTEEKIRVHNQGKRDFTLPPAKSGGKTRLLPAGRAIEIESALAEKMIAAYPNDLIEFDSLVSGDKKNLTKENARLESENSRLSEKVEKLESENESLKAKIADMEATPETTGNEDESQKEKE